MTDPPGVAGLLDLSGRVAIVTGALWILIGRLTVPALEDLSSCSPRSSNARSEPASVGVACREPGA
jgi:hypothetical protein